ncbi:methyltransferase LaeA [Xylariaceae sp. FL1019]|nr:methyltransferase LaeA [Xylariaceae sp. FL1019]
MDHHHTNGHVLGGGPSPHYTPAVNLPPRDDMQREFQRRDDIHREQLRYRPQGLEEYEKALVDEHGRKYSCAFGKRYMLPCDLQENDRLDIFHKYFLVTRQAERTPTAGLYLGPVPEHPRILDLGCGTGIWAIDVAERFGLDGNYHIEGWDLNLIQPEKIPRGIYFSRRDVEEPWTNVPPNFFDLIHMRMLNGSIMNWERLYREIFLHLKPGVGIIEQVEIDWRPKCARGGEEGELRASKLAQWSAQLHQAFQLARMPLEGDPDVRERLENLGYVDVKHTVTNIPYNSWPDQEHEKEMARWFNLGLTQGLDALTLRPLTEFLHIPEPAVRDLIECVKEDICKRQWRAYCTMHIWTARRPPLRQA